MEKANGDIGLAPSNYVESCDITATVAKAPTATKAPTTTKAPTPAIAVEIIKEASASCAPKWAIALFAFTPESSEETSLEDHEQVLITDYVSNKDWWTIEHKDGASGIVPSSYVKFQDEYEADLRAEEEQEEKKRLEAAATATREMEKKRQQEQDQRDKERQRELAEHNRMKEQEEKEKARQAEAERRRKMQEEAKQREIDAKRQASVNEHDQGSRFIVLIYSIIVCCCFTSIRLRFTK